MLAGLIFATEDAVDRPGMLAATLPFGGATLIEFQARLLHGAGAAQIIVVVRRVTPELLGAVNRMGRRGLSVDVVRSPPEALEKLHPLARILVFADGLVSTAAIVAMMGGEGGDALLVTTDASGPGALERVGADAVWAGLARISVKRVGDVAALPIDYDFASTLLRVTAQAGAVHVPLPKSATRGGHGVERNSHLLKLRNDRVVAAFASDRIAWVDRFVLAPIASRALPLLVARGMPDIVLASVGAVLIITGLAILGWGWAGVGLPIVVIATMTLAIGALLSSIRDAQGFVRAQQMIAEAGSATALIMIGYRTLATGTDAGLVVAGATVVAIALTERAAHQRTRIRWWATPLAYPLLMLPFVWAGQSIQGLAVMAGYATLSLAGAIEVLRKKP